MQGTMFHTGVSVLGGGAAGLGASTQPASPASAMAPGARMQSAGGGGSNPFLPTHPAGVALWVGLGAIAAFCLLWYSLPA